MQLTSVVAALAAAGLSSAALQAGQADTDSWTSTVSSTTTIYQTVTITRCNPNLTSCPATSSATPTPSPVANVVNTTSEAWGWPEHNSTVKAGPTGAAHFSNSTEPSWSSSAAAITTTTTAAPVVAPSTTDIPTAGAAGLFVQSGMMLGLVAAGVAILA